MRNVFAGCLFAFAACRGSAPTVEVTPVGAGRCLPPASSLSAIAVDASDEAVSFCFLRAYPEEGAEPVYDCWSMGLARGEVHEGGGVPSYGPNVPPYGADVDPDGKVVRVCPNGPQAEGCVDHTIALGPGERVVSADVDAGNRRIAYVVESGDGTALPRVVVEDTGSGAVVGRFGFGDESFRCGMPQFVGDSVLVAAGICAGPAATGELFTDRGVKVGDVGPAPASPDGARFDIYGVPALPLDGDRWAFLSSTGETVVVQDVRTGRIERVIDIGQAAGTPVRWSSPGELGWAKTPSGKLAIVMGGPELGTVFLVDPATGSARKVGTPTPCPEGGS